MTKDELIARLRSLGEQLNRDVSLTGTKSRIPLQASELKEELDDTDETAGQDTPLSRENVLTGHDCRVGSAQPDTVILDTSELVTVVALVKLHTDALHATRDEPVAFVLPGTAFRVSAGVAAEMTERGLARTAEREALWLISITCLHLPLPAPMKRYAGTWILVRFISHKSPTRCPVTTASSIASLSQHGDDSAA
jgi:hypothetical protein